MKDLWNVIDKFFNQNNNNIIKHQTESFNHFMDTILPQIIEASNPLIVKKEETPNILIVYTITISNPVYTHPMENNTEIYPYQARMQNLTYSGTILVKFQL